MSDLVCVVGHARAVPTDRERSLVAQVLGPAELPQGVDDVGGKVVRSAVVVKAAREALPAYDAHAPDRDLGLAEDAREGHRVFHGLARKREVGSMGGDRLDEGPVALVEVFVAKD